MTDPLIVEEVHERIDRNSDLTDAEILNRLQLWARTMDYPNHSLRDALIDIAAYAQAIVERIDRQDAQT